MHANSKKQVGEHAAKEKVINLHNITVEHIRNTTKHTHTHTHTHTKLLYRESYAWEHDHIIELQLRGYLAVTTTQNDWHEI